MATRDFKEIPGASDPAQQIDIDTYLKEQISDPKIAQAAKQAYDKQVVQSNELLSGSTLATPTTVGQAQVSAPTIQAATPASATTIATPTALTAPTTTAAQ